MIRIAVDTNAIADFTRDLRDEPPHLRDAEILLPLPVVGELLSGAHQSRQVARNLALVDDLLTLWTVLHPTLETARIYGRVRAHLAAELKSSRINDLWIAALCLQHDLPLLTNDRGFDSIEGLTVIHW
ncbi:MAG TPA: PIN domain-containing protein [Thermoanaerobaculia bacterium]|nr:PIN domain-containing protein [Thermoanaerobaculia bacterium]